jgi:hypothetical protein
MSPTSHCRWLAGTVYNTARNIFLGVISRFRREVDNNCVLIGYYAVRSGTGSAVTQNCVVLKYVSLLCFITYLPYPKKLHILFHITYHAPFLIDLITLNLSFSGTLIRKRIKLFNVYGSVHCKYILLYRVSIKSFPDYKHLLQENYVE